MAQKSLVNEASSTDWPYVFIPFREIHNPITTETVTLWAVFLLSHLWTTWEGVQWGIVKGRKVVLQQKSKSFSSWKRRQNNDRVSKLLCIWEPLRQSETASLEKLASLARVCVWWTAGDREEITADDRLHISPYSPNHLSTSKWALSLLLGLCDSARPIPPPTFFKAPAFI